MRYSNKSVRRLMRNIARNMHHDKRSVRAWMRRGNKMKIPDPAKYPGIFGTDPDRHPKNRYQWRMIMTGHGDELKYPLK